MARTGKSDTIELRIIAGDLRSRKIQFRCDHRTRPMKDRTREAVMNLLGGTFPNTFAFDLFGGSGILAFEALSRGAKKGVIWEILKPRALDIGRFSKELGLADRVAVRSNDSLRWTLDGGLEAPEWAPYYEHPWLVFVCPPYSLWESEGEAIQNAVRTWLAAAPRGSLIAIEMQIETDDSWLPPEISWDVRQYAPAKIAIAETGSSTPIPQDHPS
ncbi:MAG: RsmD family RNA methyltransferase [Planctomycetota bacterium]|jgi:16S rRNA (guanine966-N2)-methyltransferase